MDDESVISLFDGMTILQAREFRKRIIPTLRGLREAIVSTVDTEPKQEKPKRTKRTATPRKGRESKTYE